MEQIDLKQLIEQYPEVLTDHTKLKAYILDLYPNCKRGMVNILVAIQQCGIVSEMQASKNPFALDMSRWKKVLDDDYGFTGATAETCLQMWCIAVGIQLETKVKATQKTSILRPEEEKEEIQTSASSDLQNSQKNWFEYNYDKTILLKLKEKYEDYRGAIYIPKNPKKLTSIGSCAFKDCTGLTSITIPNNVKNIGDSAFGGCTGLTSVIIGNGVTSIGKWTFNGCAGLTSITIPDSVKSIGDSAFVGCAGLTSVTIGKGVTSIGNWTFKGCTGLTSITIPDSVASIRHFAFKDCSSLTSITIGNGITSISDGAFYGCPIEDANIPISVVNALPEAKRIYGNVKWRQEQKEKEERKRREQERKAREEKERRERELAETKRREEQKRLEQQRLALEKERREKGVCQHCGGEFKGLFIKKCVYCGRKKDY